MSRDYYPVLARAIAGLEEKTAGVRQAVYDHARTMLIQHMRDLDAGLSAGLSEFHALEEAILKVELEAVGPEELKRVSIDEAPSIAERAYLLWEQAGRPEGQALEHWLRAEAERSAEQSAETSDALNDKHGR